MRKLIILTFILLSSVCYSQPRYNELTTEIQQLKAELESLKKDNMILKQAQISLEDRLLEAEGVIVMYTEYVPKDNRYKFIVSLDRTRPYYQVYNWVSSEGIFYNP